MPEYTVRDPKTNRTVTLRGDSPPSEAELEQIFSTLERGAAQMPADGPMDAVRGAVSMLNPLPMVDAIGRMFVPPNPSSVVGVRTRAGVRSAGPVDAIHLDPARFVGGVVAAQDDVRRQAAERYRQGDYAGAAVKALEWLIPFLGPALSDAGNDIQEGRPWRGVGKAVGAGLALVGPKVVENAQLRVPAVARNTNPAEAAALRFAEERGVPVDAATASGNPFVRNVQTATANTPLGSLPAMRGQAAQVTALKRVGSELADAVYPEAVTPEQAGQSVRESLNFQVRKLHGKANQAYDRLRKYEADPELSEQVPSSQAASARRVLNEEAKRTAGRAPSDAEWSELRRMREELDAIGYSEGGTIRNASRHYQAGDDMRQSEYVKPAGGSPVYHDILQEAPGTAGMTRKAVQVSIEQALKTGKFTNAAKGALVVAQKRLQGSLRVSKPMLPPGAGAVESATETMLLPADVRSAKAALQPIYDRIMRQLPVTQQRSSPALKAMENILTGPDYAPITQLEQDLGAIKALARGADLPELRDMSQGIAATAVKQLDAAVREAAAKAGVGAMQALQEGRAATRGKYAVGDVLKQLRDEPVQAFGQAVYAKDAGVNLLRQMQKYAPAEMPRLGRAYLDDLLSKATADGGFDKAKTLETSWQNMGPQTKAILFPERGQVQALDNYFRLAKMIGRNPNPSGTALVGTSLASVQALFYAPMATVAGNAGAFALSSLLRSPKATQLFTRGTSLVLGPGRTSATMRAAGVADIVNAAREAGIQVQTARRVGSAGPEESARRQGR